MTTIVRSGEGPFPNPPRVTMELPDGWEPLSKPEVVVAGALAEWKGFRPNVCITTERVAGVVAAEDVGRDVWETFAKSEEFEGNGHAPMTGFGGHASYGMEGAFYMAEVGTIYQVCVVTVVPHGEVSDIVYAVGSTDGAKTQYIADIRTIIESAKLIEPAGEA